MRQMTKKKVVKLRKGRSNAEQAIKKTNKYKASRAGKRPLEIGRSLLRVTWPSKFIPAK